MTIVPDNKHNDLTTLGLDAQGFADLQELEALETTSAIERGDLAALFTGFVNFSLPVDSVDAGVYEWERINGNAVMRINAAKIIDPTTGARVYQIPYGKMARAILLHICTEAVRTGDPTIDLGSSAAEYLTKLGFTLGGKTRYSLYRQIQAVAGMHVSISTNNSKNQGFGFEEAELMVSKARSLWFSARPEDADQDSLLTSTITLTDDFMNALVGQGHAMPVDEGAWRYINTHSRSAFPLDIYTWLSYRLRACPESGIKVTWERLRDQFGSTMSTHEFARYFRKHLPLVLDVYPQAGRSVTFVRGGVILRYAPSPIPELSQSDSETSGLLEDRNEDR